MLGNPDINLIGGLIKGGSGQCKWPKSLLLRRSPSTVWRILADVEHWPDWTPTVVEIKPLSSSGLMVGTRYRVVQPKLRPAVYEVTECVSNEAFTWAQKLPGGTIVADHRLSARGDATQVELSFTSKGLLANVICKMLSRVISD